jgi:integrase
MGWRLLAATGMRRGEALALRWRDVDLDAGRLAVRRSVGVVKAKGASERLVEGPTKTGQSRVVDLDVGTVAALRAYPGSPRPGHPRPRPGLRARAERARRHPPASAAVLPPLRRPGDPSAQGAGEEQLPAIRLHDLRQTHATLLLADGVPVKVVGAPGLRQRHHHAHRPPARPPRHGPPGGRPLRGAA